VRVVTFGSTPRQPSPTEVFMRLIGLAVILAVVLIAASSAIDQTTLRKRLSAGE